jgi:hypothetical protein
MSKGQGEACEMDRQNAPIAIGGTMVHAVYSDHRGLECGAVKSSYGQFSTAFLVY